MALQGPVLPSSDPTLTLTTNNTSYVYTGSNPTTWTLDSAYTSTGFLLFLVNKGAGIITVVPSGGDQIYKRGVLVSSDTISPGATLQVLCDGTNWVATTIATPSSYPTFDNCNVSLSDSSSMISSGDPLTVTQDVTPGAYGLVILWQLQALGTGMYLTDSNCTVTIGPDTLTEFYDFDGPYLGGGGIAGDTTYTSTGEFRLFGANNLTGGSAQNVTAIVSTNDPSNPYSRKSWKGAFASFTYNNVTTVGVPQIGWGGSGVVQSASVSITPHAPSIVWGGAFVTGWNPAGVHMSSFNMHTRLVDPPWGQSNIDCHAFGDMYCITTDEITLTVTSNNANDAVIAVNLY